MNTKTMKIANVIIVCLVVAIIISSTLFFTMVKAEPVVAEIETLKIEPYILKKTEVAQIENQMTELKAKIAENTQEINETAAIVASLKSDKPAQTPPTTKPSKPTSRGMLTERTTPVSSINLTVPSGLNAYELDQVLEGTGLAGLGEDFILAEHNHGVNALFLVSLGAHEGEWGNSNFSKTRNNIFGFMSYDSNTNATKRFETKGECINHVAKFLKTHYLTEGGKYFKGYTLKDVNKKYASDDAWHVKIGKTMVSLQMKVNKLDK